MAAARARSSPPFRLTLVACVMLALAAPTAFARTHGKRVKGRTIVARILKTNSRARSAQFTFPWTLTNPPAYLSPMTPDGLARLKWLATTPFMRSAPVSPSAPVSTAVTAGSAEGLNQTDNNTYIGHIVSPSDSSGAIGRDGSGGSAYVELVNEVMGVFKPTTLAVDSGAGKIGKMALPDFVGAPHASPAFDVQLIWDEVTQRWYYAADYQENPSTMNAIALGWSKTANPNAPGGWCNYIISTDTPFEDYPKLGQSNGFIIVGANEFSDGTSAGTFTTARVFTVQKPDAGTSCPGARQLQEFPASGTLTNQDGTSTVTPVPVNITESSADGYVLSAHEAVPTASKLMEWRVDNTGALIAQGDVSVTSFTTPPNAAQSGSSNRLDTLDTRLMNAVGRTDPTTGVNKLALWTQHTIRTGSGSSARSSVRWYEILPGAPPTVRQSGTLANGTNYYFNGAVSPTGAGNEAIVSFNASSSSTFPSARAQSHKSTDPLGTMGNEVTIQTSPANDADFTCPGGTCRWGDYAGLTPDPTVTNRVFGSIQLVAASHDWTTWNFALTP